MEHIAEPLRKGFIDFEICFVSLFILFLTPSFYVRLQRGPRILAVGSRITVCAGKAVFRGLVLQKSRVQIRRENQIGGRRWHRSCLCLLVQERFMDEGHRA